jgi:hypothetical protein
MPCSYFGTVVIPSFKPFHVHFSVIGGVADEEKSQELWLCSGIVQQL